MRTIILFLIFMIGFAVSAQTLLTSQILTPNTYVNVPTDYKLAVVAPGVWLITAPQNNPTTQDFVCKLDTIVGTNPTNVAVALYGRKSILSAYDQIGSTVNWKLTTKDTVIVISNTTANRYREYKAVYTLTGAGSVAGLKNQEFKLYNE